MEKNTFFFRKGKPNKDGKARLVSFTKVGKVILSNDVLLEKGYYQCGTLRELRHCIIAENLKPVNYDYYEGMGYNKFRDMLKERGYEISFEMPFEYQSPLDEVIYNETRLVAFSKDLNMVIVADSIRNRTKFNNITCYLYGVDGLRNGLGLRTMGTRDSLVVDLTLTKRGMDPLHFVESMCCKTKLSSIDHVSLPYGFTYADNPESIEDFVTFDKKFKDSCSEELKKYLYKS